MVTRNQGIWEPIFSVALSFLLGSGNGKGARQKIGSAMSLQPPWNQSFEEISLAAVVNSWIVSSFLFFLSGPREYFSLLFNGGPDPQKKRKKRRDNLLPETTSFFSWTGSRIIRLKTHGIWHIWKKRNKKKPVPNSCWCCWSWTLLSFVPFIPAPASTIFSYLFRRARVFLRMKRKIKRD